MVHEMTKLKSSLFQSAFCQMRRLNAPTFWNMSLNNTWMVNFAELDCAEHSVTNTMQGHRRYLFQSFEWTVFSTKA